MSNLLVGNDDCKYNDIAEILAGSKNVTTWWPKLVARLGLGKEINSELIQTNLWQGSKTIFQVQLKILEEWQKIMGNQARLGSLIETLESLKETGVVDELKEKYGIYEEIEDKEKFTTVSNPVKKIVNDPNIRIMVIKTASIVVTTQKIKFGFPQCVPILEEEMLHEMTQETNQKSVKLLLCPTENPDNVLERLLIALPYLRVRQRNFGKCTEAATEEEMTPLCQTKLLLLTESKSEMSNWNINVKVINDKLKWAHLSNKFKETILSRKIQLEYEDDTKKDLRLKDALAEYGISFDVELDGYAGISEGTLISLVKNEVPIVAETILRMAGAREDFRRKSKIGMGILTAVITIALIATVTIAMIKPKPKIYLWDSLDPTTKLGVKMKQVQLQGWTTNVSRLIQVMKLGDDTVDKVLNPAVLKQLIESDGNAPVVLLNSNNVPNQKIFNSRTLSRMDVVDNKIFQSKSTTDTLVFSDIDLNDLSYLSPQRPILSSEYFKSHKTPFVLLNYKSDFADIARKSGTRVHWLHYLKTGSNFQWKQSSGGSMAVIRTAAEDTPTKYNETDILAQASQPTLTPQPICISGKAGMGKGAVMTKISQNILKANGSSSASSPTLVFLLNLDEYIPEYWPHYKTTTRITIERVWKTLSFQILGDTDPTTNLLQALLKSELRIDLLFSKLDNLEEESIPLVLKLLTLIRYSSKSVRIIISTRTQHKASIEDALSTLCFSMELLSDSEQVEALVFHWNKKSVDLPLNSRNLQKYARSVVDKVNSVLVNSTENLLGVPLHSQLVAELLYDEAVKHALEGNALTSFSTLSVRIVDLFEEYVQKRLDANFRTMTFDREELMQSHTFQAVDTLFPKWSSSLASHFPRRLPPKILELSEFIHGVHRADGHRLKIVHRTLAEYFVAKFISAQFIAFGNKNSGINADSAFWRFLEDAALKTSEPFVFSVYNYEVVGSEFQFPSMWNFVNSILDCSQPTPLRSQLSLSGTQWEKVLWACAYGNLPHLFEWISTGRPNGGDPAFLEKLVQVAFATGGIDFANLILKNESSCPRPMAISQESKPLPRSPPEEYLKLLQMTASRGKLSLFLFLLDEFHLRDALRWAKSDLIFATLCNSLDDPAKVIGDKVKVVEMLHKIRPSSLNERDYHGKTPILCDDVHIDLLSKVIKLGGDSTVTDAEGDSVIHTAAQYLSPENYDRLVSTVLPERSLRRLVNLRGSAGFTPLLSAVLGMDPRNGTFHRFADAGADFNVVNKFGMTPLVMAVVLRRSAVTIANLIKFGAKINLPSVNGTTPLHHAAQSCNAPVTKLLVDFGALTNLTTKIEGMTPLQQMAEGDIGQQGCCETLEILLNETLRSTEGDTFFGQLWHIFRTKAPDYMAMKLVYLAAVCGDISSGVEATETLINIFRRPPGPLGISDEELETLFDICMNAGANFQVKVDGSKKNSLLHLAATQMNVKGVSLLVNRAGLNRNTVNGDWATALEVMKMRRCHSRGACPQVSDPCEVNCDCCEESVKCWQIVKLLKPSSRFCK